MKSPQQKPLTKKKFLQRNKPWYHLVTDDISVIADAIEFYENKADEGSSFTALVGRFGDLAMETPGLIQYYTSIYEDCASIRKWMEERLKIEEAIKYKWYMNSPEAKAKYGELKTTEASKFVKADGELADMTDNIRLVAASEHQLGALIDGLKNRSIVLSNLTHIYKEGLEERWIDSSKENDE